MDSKSEKSEKSEKREKHEERLNHYIDCKKKGTPVYALLWEAIVWEVQQSIGDKNAEIWLDGIKDILDDPYFVKDPLPDVPKDLIESRLNSKKYGYLKGHIWVAPHHAAYRKLGYYRVWDGELNMTEVFGESEVRKALNITKNNDPTKLYEKMEK